MFLKVSSQVRQKLIPVHYESYKGITVPLVVSVEWWAGNPHDRVGNRQEAKTEGRGAHSGFRWPREPFL